mmetsp:Transcript_28183/g.62409  ORF Transcript_28183/g.62409 Transcript_28183/m.62409 type:complete len:205 (-) Transcript_28183:1087-1701(-)
MATTFSIRLPVTRNWPGNLSSVWMSKCSSRSSAKDTLSSSCVKSSMLLCAGIELTSLNTRCISSRVPSFAAADMPKMRLWPAASKSCLRRAGSFARTSGRSHLFTITTWVFWAKAGLNSSSSWLMALKSPTGSAEDPSTTWISTRHRWMCLRNAMPSPTPSCAPSKRPGISNSTRLGAVPASPAWNWLWKRSHTPRLGTMVVKG